MPLTRGFASRTERLPVVLELLVPIGAAPFGCEIEDVPKRLDRADVARVLSGFGRRGEELGAPEVSDRIAVASKHVQHRHLLAVTGLSVIVAVVRVARR